MAVRDTFAQSELVERVQTDRQTDRQTGRQTDTHDAPYCHSLDNSQRRRKRIKVVCGIEMNENDSRVFVVCLVGSVDGEYGLPREGHQSSDGMPCRPQGYIIWQRAGHVEAW